MRWESWVCPIPTSISPCQLPTCSSTGKHFPEEWQMVSAGFWAQPGNHSWGQSPICKPTAGPGLSKAQLLREEIFHQSVQHLGQAPSFPCHQDLRVKNTASHVHSGSFGRWLPTTPTTCCQPWPSTVCHQVQVVQGNLGTLTQLCRLYFTSSSCSRAGTPAWMVHSTASLKLSLSGCARQGCEHSNFYE